MKQKLLWNSLITVILAGWLGCLTPLQLYASSSNTENNINYKKSTKLWKTQAAVLSVSGKDQPITSGTTTAAANNGTSFGLVSDAVITSTTFQLVNTGDQPLEISAVASSNNTFTISAPDFPATIAVGDTADLVITFTPDAQTQGVQTSTITISSNVQGGDFTFAIDANPSGVQNTLDFDGVDDIINSKAMVTGSYTKEALVFLRVRSDESTNNNNIISGNSVTANTAFWIPTGNGRKLAAGHDGEWNTVQDTAVFPTGRWMHVAVTFDAVTKTLTLYKNGVVVSQKSNILTTAYTAEGGDQLQVGGFVDGNFLKGSLDEVRIWNNVRTAEEIQGMMSTRAQGSEQGLIAYYSFDQGTAGQDNANQTVAYDNTPNGNTGALSNFSFTGNTSNYISSNAFSADILPPSGYTVATQLTQIDTTNQTNFSFTIGNIPNDAVTYYYSITDTADVAISGTGTANGTEQQVTGLDLSSFADGDLIVAVIMADELGNTGAAANVAISKDTNVPMAVFSSTYDSVTNQSPIPLTIAFGEPISGFTLNDLEITNGTGDELVTNDSSTFTVNITPDAEGKVTATLPENTVTDAQGTNNVSSSFTIVYNLSALTVAISTQADSVLTQNELAITITFSSAVSGFDLSDIAIDNGTADTLVTGDSTIFTTSITIDQADTVTVSIPANVATDAQNNTNSAAVPLKRIYLPGDGTSVTIATEAVNPTNLDSIPVNITFSSAVSGFALQDLVLANATASALVTQDSTTFATSLIPANDGVLTLFVPADVATDSIGLGNIESDTFRIRYDGTMPTVTLNSNAADTITGEVNISAVFSEKVSGLEASSFTVSGLEVTSLQTEDSTTFVATVNPTAGGDLTIVLDSAAVTDAAGNGNTASDPLVFYYDNQEADLTVTLSSEVDSITRTSPVPLVIKFNKPVSGFTVGGITADNATIENLTTSDSVSFEANIVPGNDTTIMVFVAANSAQDAAGNGNAASDTLSFVFDGTAPGLTISSQESDTTQASTFSVNFEFTEAVSGFDSTDIMVDSATVSNLQTSDSTTFTADVMTMSAGTIMISVPDSAVVDAAGNTNTGDTLSIYYEEAVTGIDDLLEENSAMKLYPVPSKDYLKVAFQLRESAKVRIELRNVSGKLISRKNLGKTIEVDETLWLYSVPEGVYILSVYTNNKQANKKIVVSH